MCKTSDRRWVQRSIVEECFQAGECPAWWGGFGFDIPLGRKAALENGSKIKLSPPGVEGKDGGDTNSGPG